MNDDGLNTLKYKLTGVDRQMLYTKLLVTFDGPSSVADMAKFIRESVNPSLIDSDIAYMSSREADYARNEDSNKESETLRGQLDHLNPVINVFKLPSMVKSFSRTYQNITLT